MHKQHTAIITGAAHGIGLALAKAYAAQGCRVIAVDKNPMPPEKPHTNLHAYTLDLASEEAIQTMFAWIGEHFGPVHILINNAAIAHFHKNFAQLTSQEFDAVLGVNLRAAMLCAQAFLRCNAGQPYGRIINIASTRASQNEAGWEAYGASKGGLVALGASLAISLASTPITVNTVSPGWIQTEGYELLRPQDHAQHPSGRVGMAHDIVNACLFLTHPDNDFVNAANLVVDGGMSKKMQYVD